MDRLLADSQTRMLLVAALLVLMVACAVVGAALVARAGRQQRSRAVVDRALAARDGHVAELPPAGRMAAVASAAEHAGAKLEHGKLGDSLLASDDRKLIDACGFRNPARARAWFMLARLLLAGLAPLAAWLVLRARHADLPLAYVACAVFLGFGLGWMVPKWMLLRRIARRRECAEAELPLFIDLLRLLQGVGLSVDQSMHVLIQDFRSVMPVLGGELKIAAEQYARGRTREQSLSRLAQGFDNDDLSAICRLIVQVDRHGGAVQDPLARFAERVRERRRLELKARVARLTVKMTGVMVVTLLPALLIITGGSGFVALLRGMSQVMGEG